MQPVLNAHLSDYHLTLQLFTRLPGKDLNPAEDQSSDLYSQVSVSVVIGCILHCDDMKE